VTPPQVAPLPRRAHAALLSATLALLGACAPGLRPSTAPTPARPDVPATTPADLPEPTASATTPFPMPARPHVHLPGVSFDLDVHAFEDEERVQHYVRLFTGNARTTFTTWLARGSRYDGMIRAKLRAGGLPEDLYYLPLVESGYDPNAVSRASAVGMWQFMAPTARGLGLRVDWWMDERRDPVRATDGAVRHLRWLKGQYGSFFLAAAAYNGGSTRVSRGLAQLAAASDSSAGDARFFALVDADYLRPETKNYVPQLIAATLVAKELPRYRLTVREQAPFAYDSVLVAPLTPLAAVARAANASRAELLELNPQFLRGMTPPDARVTVRLPVGAASGFATRLAKLDAEQRRAFRRVTTRKRDSLEDIAAREEVPLALLTAYNPALETVAKGKWKGKLVSGQGVRVPTAAVLEYARPTTEANDAAGTGELPPLPAPKVAERPARGEQKAQVAERTTEKSDASEKSEKSDAKASERTREKVVAKADAKPDTASDADSSRETKRAIDRTSAGEIARDADADAKTQAPAKARGAKADAIAPMPLATVVRVKPASAKTAKGASGGKPSAAKTSAADEEPRSDARTRGKSAAPKLAKAVAVEPRSSKGKSDAAKDAPIAEKTKPAPEDGAKLGAKSDSKSEAKPSAKSKASAKSETTEKAERKSSARASSDKASSDKASAGKPRGGEAPVGKARDADDEKSASKAPKSSKASKAAAKASDAASPRRERAAVDSAARRRAKRADS
jgi:membrane-bound lytic murein transglycosylase D